MMRMLKPTAEVAALVETFNFHSEVPWFVCGQEEECFDRKMRIHFLEKPTSRAICDVADALTPYTQRHMDLSFTHRQER